MPLHIVHNDITEMDTDIIVNAANNYLQAGGGVCGAIFSKAGRKLLQEECDKLGYVETGCAVITKGYNLKAKYIVHAVGPVYRDGKHKERELLENSYLNSLNLAIDHQCQSISFPLISSGIYGYPKAEALEVAVSTISHFLLQHDIEVYIVVFDRQAVTLSEKLFDDITHYIDSYYEPEIRRERVSFKKAISDKKTLKKEKIGKTKLYNEYGELDVSIVLSESTRSLEDLVNNVEETFSEMLFRLIDEKGYDDVDVYKRANIDRKLFSKIRSHKDYHPSKKTCLALSISLKLSLDETIDLLNKAGYSLSLSQKGDIIVRYFIDNHDYDIYKINEALFCFNESTL